MNFMKTKLCCFLLSCCLSCLASTAAAADASLKEAAYAKKATWADTVIEARAALRGAGLPEAARATAATRLWEQIRDDFPMASDWAMQDAGLDFAKRFFAAEPAADLEQKMLARVLAELGSAAEPLRKEFDQLGRSAVAGADPRWLKLYSEACAQRRAQRLQGLARQAPQIVFTKHRTIRPSFFAYTEGQSDAQAERHFLPGAELCLLEWRGRDASVRTLLKDPTGAIRDPAVSWDGTRVLFAWKKSLNEDDYHLYEMEAASGQIRQVTSGLGFADYEPAYLPNGDLIFSSSRCVQTVDCWWTEVSNLYTCDPRGRFLRRLTFDQVHSIFPQVLDDGRITYTRWDYNDRGQVFPQGLFQMNSDGTGQTEFYGNNSWFPTTIAHARGIPGTQKVLAIFCGHHSTQAGKLGVVDPAKGRQENQGAQLVAPIRETKAERIDSYGQSGELFQYPYPLSEREFLAGYAPLGWDSHSRRKGDAEFGVYWMDLDGRRELLVADPLVPCQQPVPLAARTRPIVQPSQVDYRKTNGFYYMSDIYAGPGLAGVPRGSVKKLRVIALDFRAAGVGNNGNGGPGGGAMISTPISIGNGSWDVKIVLGDATVRVDGSAFFAVPARTPVYFQALDQQGRAVQTMRSWSTLQPGEVFSCVGCHENKNTAPIMRDYQAGTLASQAGPEPLEPFYGPPRGFSFLKEVQPIFNRHCVRCHNDRSAAVPKQASAAARQPVNQPSDQVERAFSLLDETTVDPDAKRRYSDAYLALVGVHRQEAKHPLSGKCDNRLVNWISAQSAVEPLPPNTAGSAHSGLCKLLDQGHKGVQLSREERDKINCWIDLLVPYCGDYFEAGAWTAEETQKYQRYLDKRRRMEALERQNVNDFISNRDEKAQGKTVAQIPAAE